MNSNFEKKKEQKIAAHGPVKESEKKAEVKINQYDKEHIEAAMKENLKNELLSCWKKDIWFPYRDEQCEHLGKEFFIQAHPDGSETLAKIGVNEESIVVNQVDQLAKPGEGKYAKLLDQVNDHKIIEPFEYNSEYHGVSETGKTFTLIIGPAGSGKCVHGHSFCPAIVNDFEYRTIYNSKVHGMDDRLAESEALEYFGSVKEQDVYYLGIDYAVVNNVASDEPDELRAKDYKVEGYFMGLNSIEESMIRSYHEVINDKGYEYYPESVTKIFDRCYKTTLEALKESKFDKMTFIDNYSMEKASVVAVFDNTQNKLTIYDKDVQWFNDRFAPELHKLIGKNQDISM